MPHAIISGGSLSGLFAGVVLKHLGYRVTIFERSPVMVGQGAGIVCGGEVAQFFQMFDKTKTTLVVRSNARQHLNKDGGVVFGTYSNTVQQMTSWDKLFYVLRANFDGFQKDDFIYGPGDAPSTMEDSNMSYRLGHAVTGHSVDAATGRVRVEYSVRSEAEGAPPTTGTEEADVLIVAEGPAAPSRDVYLPDVKREYSGYLAFRGLVPEAELSPETAKSLTQIFTFYFGKKTQMLSYMIPGPRGDTTPGNRHLNWVWYNNYAEGTDEYKRMMTDKNGRVHSNAMRPGDLPADVIETEYRQRAEEILPPQFKEIVLKTKNPFFQRVTDMMAPKAVFHDGRVILFGDALQGPRPHTAASTNQGAVHALLLFDHLRQASARKTPLQAALKALEGEWQDTALSYAKSLAYSGKMMGDRSQFGE
ncbi:monooxygenase [Mycena galericulata]|nr:monooxygenase [Mycena galericulata]